MTLRNFPKNLTPVSEKQKYALIDAEWEPTDEYEPQTQEEIMQEIADNLGFPEGGGKWSGWKLVKWEEWIKMKNSEQ